ncbi:head decoration protein [Bradyrhizobium japonicum]|uniref:head decoration protein n=1 Tax=Bradyrhizobium japonicum TaxID=375 RepID=UPI0004048362|nr:head decoration protein [Bradyrhizobium japonicum]
MSLSVGILGENPQQPSISANTFIPDQLIAGPLQLVTNSVTVSGSAALPRGTVMGRASLGAAVSSTGKVQASGTVAIAAVPTDGDTVTIQGTVITFNAKSGVGQLPAANQVLFEASMTTAQIAQAFLAALLANPGDANLSKMTYSLSGSTITAKAVNFGTGGNAYTLATSNGTAFTVSGATLSGGTANTGTATIGSISLGAATKPGLYTITLTSATVGTVESPSGAVLGTQTMGTAFVDPEINFTITTGGSPAAGDIFGIYVPDLTAQSTVTWKLCTKGAIDGSNVPAGILCDYTDPTGGNVIAGVYEMGEFNGNAIVYDSSLSPADIRNGFRGKGIFIKSVLSAADPS